MMLWTSAWTCMVNHRRNMMPCQWVRMQFAGWYSRGGYTYIDSGYIISYLFVLPIWWGTRPCLNSGFPAGLKRAAPKVVAAEVFHCSRLLGYTQQGASLGFHSLCLFASDTWAACLFGLTVRIRQPHRWLNLLCLLGSVMMYYNIVWGFNPVKWL